MKTITESLSSFEIQVPIKKEMVLVQEWINDSLLFLTNKTQTTDSLYASYCFFCECRFVVPLKRKTFVTNLKLLLKKYISSEKVKFYYSTNSGSQVIGVLLKDVK